MVLQEECRSQRGIQYGLIPPHSQLSSILPSSAGRLSYFATLCDLRFSNTDLTLQVSSFHRYHLFDSHLSPSQTIYPVTFCHFAPASLHLYPSIHNLTFLLVSHLALPISLVQASSGSCSPSCGCLPHLPPSCPTVCIVSRCPLQMCRICLTQHWQRVILLGIKFLTHPQVVKRMARIPHIVR